MDVSLGRSSRAPNRGPRASPNLGPIYERGSGGVVRTGALATWDHPSGLTECATLYRRAPTGFVPREDRPHVLCAGILARIPPLETP